jgi:Flp pilus assembly pilin Flp
MLCPTFFRALGRVLRDETGYESLEYALLLTFIILPLTQLIPFLVDMLRTYYELIAFTVSLPIP